MELVKVRSSSSNSVPAINVNKTGVMRLSPALKEGLKLKVGDKVGFYHDKDKPKDWFIKINDDDVTLRNADTAKAALLANSSVIANTILKSLGLTTKASMRVVLKPIEKDTYCILTSSAKGL